MPDVLPGDLLDKGLSPEHVGLVTEAWAESGRNQLDGRLHHSRAKKLRGWDEDRAHALVIAGAFVSTPEHIDLVGYLDVNDTRETIQQRRLARSLAGQAGGAARVPKDAPRLPDGTLATTTCPLHGGEWRRGDYGWKCTAKAAPGEPANHRGYCTMTPDKARDYLAARQVSGPLSGPVTVTGTVVPVSTEEATDSDESDRSSGDASGRECTSCGRRVDGRGLCRSCQMWKCDGCEDMHPDEWTAKPLNHHCPGLPS